MINKIKAMFAAIGTIGVLMFTVSILLWTVTNYPNLVLEFCMISFFAYWGYMAYNFFLKEFENRKKNKQINS